MGHTMLEGKMKDSINWGFIGCGRVVQTKSGNAFRSIQDSSIHTIMRRDIQKARESAKLFDAKFYCDNLHDFFSSEINAVYIATPPGLHLQQASACCKMGLPVYIEKPLARNYVEAKAIIEMFEKQNVALYVGHYKRALPRFKYLKSIISSSVIGKVTSVHHELNRVFSYEEATGTWLYNPILSGGGKFYDIAPHSFDIISYLFGDIVDICGIAKNNGTLCPLEDSVVCSYETSQGIIGTARYNLISQKKFDRMFVFGTEGKMEFSIHGDASVIVERYHNNGPTLYSIPDPEVVEQPMVQMVIRALQGEKTDALRGRDALNTYWALDKVLDTFYHGRDDDFWNHKERWTGKSHG